MICFVPWRHELVDEMDVRPISLYAVEKEKPHDVADQTFEPWSRKSSFAEPRGSTTGLPRGSCAQAKWLGVWVVSVPFRCWLTQLRRSTLWLVLVSEV